MSIYNASQYGIEPGKDCTIALAKLLATLQADSREKTLLFPQGTYFINSEACRQHMLHITNTVGDNEFSEGETPHRAAVAFYLSKTENLTIDGGGSVFIIDGKVTNIALEDCKNITLKNLEIRHSHPDMHVLRVAEKHLCSVDFEIDRATQYKIADGQLRFYGNGYETAALKNAWTAYHIGRIRANAPEQVRRVAHPLRGAWQVKEIGAHRIRVYGLPPVRFAPGDSYYLYDVRRQYAGIFLNRCKDITLAHIKQRFNYSLALAAQDSEDITVDSVTFAPEENGERRLASAADFIQLCMCRGTVTVQNSLFDGAGDDCLNVHGIHFQITSVQGQRLRVRFMHPQTHGFNPLRVGDTIAYINPNTLQEEGRAVLSAAKLLNEYELELTVSSTNGAKKGAVIEDVSACPNLCFQNNTINRIITRGLLLTTRGKVTLKKNRFLSTAMSGILLSNDAKSWYESGRCEDVTIEENTFACCGQTPIRILPENKVYAGAVHTNITMRKNHFQTYSGYAVTAKDTDHIRLIDNTFSGKMIRTKRCNDVEIRCAETEKNDEEAAI